MHLVLYSGGTNKLNRKLDRELLRSTGKEAPKITYVPFTYYEHPRYYEQFKKYFQHYGVSDFRYFAPNKSYTRKTLQRAFESDIIFLSSGNTFTFLKNLRQKNLIPLFRRFLKRGGILAGASAGAIVMTPNIMTAMVPTIDSDANTARIKNLNAMNLVGFEFSPHFSKEHSEELRSYSRMTPFTVLACDDGSGLVIKGDKVKIVGKVFRFKNGRKTEINSRYMTTQDL